MLKRDIPYYRDYLSDELLAYLLEHSSAHPSVQGLTQQGPSSGLETPEALSFLCALYETLKGPLHQVLNQRKLDRDFLDQRTRSCFALNKKLENDFLSESYETVISHQDGNGRMVMGPKNEHYAKRGYGKPIAPLPEYLKGNHVTLFGPPDDAKLSINAMNAFHRKLKDEPAIVAEILALDQNIPKWGADDEDSKTPLRQDLVSAGVNLTGCFEKTIQFTDSKNHKTYTLEKERLALPIKRFPGLALPCSFLFYKNNPLPLHLYDFTLHLYKNWNLPHSLCYYVPKLENEEEAAYIKLMVEEAEKLLKKIHPEYQIGTIRLMIVLENPRAIFRVNEIMDALYPYFAGASLGWHDYLASTARLFKEDSNYRIPVKADPNIVIQYIKASHDLLAEVVGSRGGIKVGGMYGILPIENDLKSPSFQLTMKGFIKDVITQMKRNLSGFWVAHPDFVRIGLALVKAYEIQKETKSSEKLNALVTSLLTPEHHQEILDFIQGPDIQGLKIDHPLYPRSLIVADLKESKFIANHDPSEIRYNVFQTLQYLTDWLSGNGCVALPAEIAGVPVRVMDDLATAERSRWEVWHEIYHGRFSIHEFLKIAHEEMLFIRKDFSDQKKIVQVKWNERTEKWYPIAFKLMLKLMTDPKPPEFATELLLPFTIESIRNSANPFEVAASLEPKKYRLSFEVENFNRYFEACGCMNLAKKLSQNLYLDEEAVKNEIQNFTLQNILEAASFHGNIGESKKTLDHQAKQEQSLVLNDSENQKNRLRELGDQYLKKFGFKYLISAQDKSAQYIENNLSERLNNSVEIEMKHARSALLEITLKRLKSNSSHLLEHLESIRKKHQVVGAQITISTGIKTEQNICLGNRIQSKDPVTSETYFELASLSKTLATAFALEYFKKKQISLDTPVNECLEKANSSFRVESIDSSQPSLGNEVLLKHLMNHQALNLHYVNGIPANQKMLNVKELLNGHQALGYEPVKAFSKPGTQFKYSGGGFLVLEHLIESFEKKKVQEVTQDFFEKLEINDLTFEQSTLQNKIYAHGYLNDGLEVEGTRKMFPAFAAGAMGTSHAMTLFLKKLGHAYFDLNTHDGISHDTAVQMLFDKDRSSQKFMGVNVGLGVFVAEAGENRFAIHQGANDGFRCLFLYCFKGPDQGLGLTILCNSDSTGVLFISEAAQNILKALNISGINFNQFKETFSTNQIPTEEWVNRGYQELIFSAFNPDLPEEIFPKGLADPLAPLNHAVGAEILDVTNQGFSRAENLISPYLPTFDPEAYERQGKVMDSWESVRHNPFEKDSVILKLKKPTDIRFAVFSTEYHLGNHAEFVELEAKVNEADAWDILVPKLKLDGHAIKKFEIKNQDSKKYSFLRVSQIPDGGLSRLWIFDHHFNADQVISKSFEHPIPHSKKPLAPPYEGNPDKIKMNIARLKSGSDIDIASQAFGGRILSASNQHYGPANQVISPYSPIHMFDGFESARSRKENHSENVVIGFFKPSTIHRVVVDFAYYRNNNPVAIQIECKNQDHQWVTIVNKTKVKAYAGNKIEFLLNANEIFSEARVTVFPDGGINRIHIFSKKT